MEAGFSSPAAAAVLCKVLLAASLCTSAALLQPFDLLYDNAVQAFYRSDYGAVVRHMEGALSSYREVRRTRVRCRLRCQDQHQFDDGFSELRFFDVVLRRAACANACVEEKLGPQSVHKISDDVLQDFHRRIPYNYLQLAYQKVKGGGCGGMVVCVFAWLWLFFTLPASEMLLQLPGNGMRPSCLHRSCALGCSALHVRCGCLHLLYFVGFILFILLCLHLVVSVCLLIFSVLAAKCVQEKFPQDHNEVPHLVSYVVWTQNSSAWDPKLHFSSAHFWLQK